MTNCTWGIDYAWCDGREENEFLESVSAEVRERAEELATELLSRWTGGVFGLCPFVVRPARPEVCNAFPTRIGGEVDFSSAALRSANTAQWTPRLIGGSWYNCPTGTCAQHQNLADNEIYLEDVHEIVQVTIDGETIPDTEWTFWDGYLVRKNGPWPTQQNLRLPDTESGTWSVTLLRGQEVSPGGRLAAGVLALEFMRALCKDDECQLPERVQTVTRQGVTVAVMDQFEDIEEGRTGIWLVDSWVASIRAAQTKVFKAYSVDTPRKTAQHR